MVQGHENSRELLGPQKFVLNEDDGYHDHITNL